MKYVSIRKLYIKPFINLYFYSIMSISNKNFVEFQKSVNNIYNRNQLYGLIGEIIICNLRISLLGPTKYFDTGTSEFIKSC